MRKLVIFLVLLILLVNITGCMKDTSDGTGLESDLEELDTIDEELDNSDLVELEEDLEVIDW